jgi:hypothetical protein
MPSKPQPRGQAAHPKYLSSLHPSKPYSFPPQIWQAAKLQLRITDKYLFFFGYEGEDPHVYLQQWLLSPFARPTDSFPGDGDVGDGVGEARSMIDFPTSEHLMM